MTAPRKSERDSTLGTLFDQPQQQEQQQAPTVFTVSQALQIAKRGLEKIAVTVQGEVSEFSDKPGYKAVYFTLTDQGGALPCLIWKNNFARSGLALRKGMLVEAKGRFSLYQAKGRMNFEATSIKLAGEGDLRVKVAELARKLQLEGLMDPARKKPVPPMPRKVAVVTSPRGKAVHDVLRTLRRRSPQVEVYVVGVPVEGKGAVEGIVTGLRCADASDCDTILLVRGGGSYEDLMPFNEEPVARAVVACTKPVVTGIGHEPDNSIADMVGDLRCSTPTAAAEACAPDIAGLGQQLARQAQRMSSALEQDLRYKQQRVQQLAARPPFSDPNFVLAPYAMRLDGFAERLPRAIPSALDANHRRLENLSAMLRGQGAHLLDASRASVAMAADTLRGQGQRLLDRPRAQLGMAAGKLDALSPLSVLSRGYAVTYDSQGHVVPRAQDVQAGANVTVRLQDGYLDCTVDATRVQPDPGGTNDR